MGSRHDSMQDAKHRSDLDFRMVCDRKSRQPEPAAQPCLARPRPLPGPCDGAGAFTGLFDVDDEQPHRTAAGQVRSDQKIDGAGQAGATSPASLPGAVVQQVAEVLAGLIYVNCLKPGAPAIFGPWPFVSDLRTGAMSGGSGEQALLMAACAQMAHFYDLTGGVCAGMTDSKLPDAQAGYEKGYNYALVANAGANLIYECAGMHASLLGFCLESLVIDNDALGATLRTVRGFEVTDEALSLDVIRETCIAGPGHFLGSRQTLGLMQRDYVYPAVGDRSSPKEWQELGSTDVVHKAKAWTRDILDRHFPAHLDRRTDRTIRRRFDIRLSEAKMRPAPS